MPLGIIASARVEADVTPPGDITVVESMTTSYVSSFHVTITFATSPVENDVIVAFLGSISPFAWAANTPPSGWSFAIPDGVVSAASAMTFGALYHIVTAAEDAANTVTWTLTSVFAGAETGATVACYVRGAYTGLPVDAYGINPITTVTTPHDLAAVTGTDITNTGGLVLRAIGRDGATAYSGTPAGHTQLASIGTDQGVWLGRLDATATAGANIATASITPAASDEGAAITLVIRPASAGPTTPTIVGTALSAGTTQSPSMTFSTSPVENDIVVLFNVSANVADCQAVANWTNALGAEATKVTPADQITYTAAWHRVTAAEDVANTVTFSIPLWWTTSEPNNSIGVYIRGAKVATPIDAVGTTKADTPVTPHVLAAVTGTDISVTGGLVLRCIASDGNTPWTTPAGHTERQALVVTPGTVPMTLYTRDTTATAATNIDAVNITPSGSEQYASATLVIMPA